MRECLFPCYLVFEAKMVMSSFLSILTLVNTPNSSSVPAEAEPQAEEKVSLSEESKSRI